MVARTRQHGTVITRDTAGGARRLVLLSADAAGVALAVPHPFGHKMYTLNLHLHLDLYRAREKQRISSLNLLEKHVKE